ncbi:MAG: hypothetical protein U0939_04705 [Pirellulales bacterium]
MVFKQVALSVLVLAALCSGAFSSNLPIAHAGDDHGFLCVMEVVVETRNNSGTLLTSEGYTKEFLLAEGGVFFDDFSTRTRFKFFNAVLDRENGDATLSVDWFADISVFNSADIATSVTLVGGQKEGASVGSTTLYTSTNSTTMRYSLRCVEQ